MKKLVLLLVMICMFTITGFSQVTQKSQNKRLEPFVYRDLGFYNVNYQDGSSITIHAYITKESNDTGYYPQYGNLFSLVAESGSIYRGKKTQTWLYGVHVFMNDVNITFNQYPNGFTAYVKTMPTVIYNWYTNDEQIGKYYFSWNSSAYEVTPN